MLWEALDGIVGKEDIVRLVNENLELEGEDELKVISDEELEKTRGMNEDGPDGNNEGDQSDKTTAD